MGAGAQKSGGAAALPAPPPPWSLWNIPSLHAVIILKLCTEAHAPAPRYGQYLTHAHNHITLAMTAMDSCVTLIGAHQHCIALGSTSGKPRINAVVVSRG